MAEKLKPFEQRVKDIFDAEFFSVRWNREGWPLEAEHALGRALTRIAGDLEYLYQKTPGAKKEPSVDEMIEALRRDLLDEKFQTDNVRWVKTPAE